MKRREFITLLGGAAAAWPLAARAQSGPARRVGVLMNGTATETPAQSYMAAFVQALRQLGWLEGQNVRIDTRWSAGDAGLARIYAAQLIGLMPESSPLRRPTSQPSSKPPVLSRLYLCRSPIQWNKASSPM